MSHPDVFRRRLGYDSLVSEPWLYGIRMPPRRATVANNNTDIAAILAQLVTQLTQVNGATKVTMGLMVGVVPAHRNALSSILTLATPLSFMTLKEPRVFCNGSRALKALFSTAIVPTTSGSAMPPASSKNERSLG
ncbi:hypothetical protein L1987_06399 [Smallanthus sonchifolius]|uniref:Uncharacterized protein n=1 Tax=Smallanthus sonchifolius TaxID=185202 RepID=A0ACB9JY01_9ASTR|nr:hypothetical protein L1987_06399 [Smallanthus sonchifolius]